MAEQTYGVRILKGGQPIEGATVTLGTDLEGVTDAQGVVEGSLDKGDRSIVVSFWIETDTYREGGTIRLVPGQAVDHDIA